LRGRLGESFSEARATSDQQQLCLEVVVCV
jgi:hypothetical protein